MADRKITLNKTFTVDLAGDSIWSNENPASCLLYTSDAADDSLRVDLPGTIMCDRCVPVDVSITII